MACYDMRLFLPEGLLRSDHEKYRDSLVLKSCGRDLHITSIIYQPEMGDT